MSTFKLIALAGQVMQNLSYIKSLSWWQLATLAGYTLTAFGAAFAASKDWKEAAVAGLSAFVIHLHGQLQPSPKPRLN